MRIRQTPLAVAHSVGKRQRPAAKQSFQDCSYWLVSHQCRPCLVALTGEDIDECGLHANLFSPR